MANSSYIKINKNKTNLKIKFLVSIQKLVTNISNFAFFVSDNLDNVIFLLAICSKSKAS